MSLIDLARDHDGSGTKTASNLGKGTGKDNDGAEILPPLCDI